MLPADRPARGGFRPVRSRAAALALRVVAWTAILYAVLGVFATLDEPRTVVLRLAAGAAGLVVFPIFYLASKIDARTAREELERDPRPPVLYLRSFATDSDQVVERWKRTAGALARFAPAGPLSEEEDLAAALRSVGPPVAIGRPGERLPTLGFARLYVPDDEWRDRVAALADDAALTVLRAGDSDGLWWELERAVRTLPPHRLLLYLPPGGPEPGGYAAFRGRAAAVLPRPLPADPGDARYVAFDPAWRPLLTRDPLLLRDDRRPPVVLLGSGQAALDGEARADGDALAAVFGGIGPVVALGRAGEALPPGCAGRMHVTDAEWGDAVRALSWRGAPVLLRVRDDDGFVRVLRDAVATVGAHRLLLHVPGRRRAARARAYEALRRAAGPLLPHPLPPGPAAPRYVCFEADGWPRLLGAAPMGPVRRLRLAASRDRAAIRCRAPVLGPVFARYRRAPPGRRIARRVWAGGAAAAVLLGWAVAFAGDEPAPTLDLGPALADGWEGFAWGTTAAAMERAFPRMGRVDTTAALTSVESGEWRSFAGTELPLRLVFSRGRLAGAALSHPSPDGGRELLARAALLVRLGGPDRTRRLRVRLQEVEGFGAMLFIGSPAMLDGGPAP